jgi:hypothetical protein
MCYKCLINKDRNTKKCFTLQVRTVAADPGKDLKLTGREVSEVAVMRAASLCLLDLMGFVESARDVKQKSGVECGTYY